MNKYLLSLFIFSILLIFFACTPQKRIERILKNNPYLLTENTITVRDTVIIPAVKADTTIITQLRDTVEIVKERLYTKIIRHNDTLMVHSECLPDTIYIEKHIPVEKIKVSKLPGHFKPRLVYFIFAASFILLALLLFLASRKKQ